MQLKLKPIKSDSLKTVFVNRFEELILSGRLSIGQKLPSERELALQLGVSRPVVHEGLVDLAAKGLVTMIPRVGTVVNDYRQEGSLAMLNSLVAYGQGWLEAGLFESLIELRRLFELETARLAARRRTSEHMDQFRGLLDEEGASDTREADRLTDLDFRFHHLVAMASGNAVYPLLINSFKEVYTNLTGRFFTDPAVASTVFGLHRDLVEAVGDRDEKGAVRVMFRLLDHGEEHLKARARQMETSVRAGGSGQ
ncbi:MAG: FadR family transcriptional regulator [Proteobacteria bacterium]|nr:FadR family transcriptional regulator [Pseudomonadota bacterium]